MGRSGCHHPNPMINLSITKNRNQVPPDVIQYEEHSTNCNIFLPQKKKKIKPDLVNPPRLAGGNTGDGEGR